jgi:hypothetical protein
MVPKPKKRTEKSKASEIDAKKGSELSVFAPVSNKNNLIEKALSMSKD